MTNISRHQTGAPASQGGQFKEQTHAEATVQLAVPAAWGFPGYDDADFTAEAALQEWIDTQEISFENIAADQHGADNADPMSQDELGTAADELQETFYQFTNREATAEQNIAAIAAGANYLGIDLDKLGYPLPTRANTLTTTGSEHADRLVNIMWEHHVEGTPEPTWADALEIMQHGPGVYDKVLAGDDTAAFFTGFETARAGATVDNVLPRLTA